MSYSLTSDFVFSNRKALIRNDSYLKQEAQLLLGRPTHSAKSIYLEVKVIELNQVSDGKHDFHLSGMRRHMRFSLRDLEITP